MKKKSYLIALSVIIMLGALVWFQEPIRASIGAFALSVPVQQPTNLNGAISTSTLNYLTPGTGTTTITLNTAGTDQLDVNIFGVASTVATTDIRWRYEFSHSTSSVPSEQLWFPEPLIVTELATTSVLTRSGREYAWRMVSSVAHRIATSSAMNGVFDQNTTGAMTIRIKDISARWTRIIFYIPTGPGGALPTDSTALANIPGATSTNAGIAVFPVTKDPL
jgi:hypothetical protein